MHVSTHDFLHYIYFAKTQPFIRGLQIRHRIDCNHSENTFALPLAGANLNLSSDRRVVSETPPSRTLRNPLSLF
jgi:hypothetical protein